MLEAEAMFGGEDVQDELASEPEDVEMLVEDWHETEDEEMEDVFPGFGYKIKRRRGKTSSNDVVVGEQVAFAIGSPVTQSTKRSCSGPVLETHHCPEARDSQVAFKPSTALVLRNEKHKQCD
ncbi:hypothetical protein BDZ89DRAFT_1045341 [Hymenopellis radicata]|nr:hypothetical protein BDZ89DRAFT_1045341 [Hymenopellis radicata]